MTIPELMVDHEFRKRYLKSALISHLDHCPLLQLALSPIFSNSFVTCFELTFANLNTMREWVVPKDFQDRGPRRV